MRPELVMAAWRSGCVVAVLATLSTSLNRPEEMAAQALPPGAKSLVFVIDDNARNSPGCDGINIYSTASQGVMFRGQSMPSPGRMAANSDLSEVYATRSNGMRPWEITNPHVSQLKDVYVARYDVGGSGVWESTYLDSFPPVVNVGGIAVTRDDRYLLIATKSVDSDDYCKPTSTFEHYSVKKFAISEIDWQGHKLGPERGTVPTKGPVAAIVVEGDGGRAHLLVVGGDRAPDRAPHIVTIEVGSMIEAAPPVDIGMIGELPNRCSLDADGFYHWPIGLAHMVLTPDERFLVVNTWARAQVSVVDLQRRSLKLVETPGILKTGGLSFSLGIANARRLAIHGIDKIAIYDWTDGTALRLVNSFSVPSPLANWPVGPQGGNPGVISGPVASVEWTWSGQELVAAGSALGPEEFKVFQINGKDGAATDLGSFEGCSERENYQNDILTGNGIVPLPSPTASATNTPQPPTRTPTLAPTPTSTHMATATVTAMAKAEALYLPLLLIEHCAPGQRRVDAVLVLDASQSMLESAMPGSQQNKLDAAREAARAFLAAIQLDQGDQAAIITFNSRARLLTGLSADRTLLETALAGISPSLQTCIVCGMDAGAQELASDRRRAENAPVLILLTDGRSNPQPASEAVERAAAAKAAGIRIYTIGLGTDLDEAALREMASNPGLYFHAPVAQELAEIYRGIAVDIPCPASAYWAGRS